MVGTPALPFNARTQSGYGAPRSPSWRYADVVPLRGAGAADATSVGDHGKVTRFHVARYGVGSTAPVRLPPLQISKCRCLRCSPSSGLAPMVPSTWPARTTSPRFTASDERWV